jgi:N-acetylmuramoyl-L-alanine amidase
MKQLFSISKAIVALAALFFVFPAEGHASSLLKNGDSNAEVKELQKQLIELDYLDTDATGHYGPLTEQAVRNFQSDFDLVVDGITGVATHSLLEEIHKLARIVYGEARGEAFEGQVAVAAVALNRVESDEFPATLAGVIYQRNAFTAVHDGQYDLSPDATAYQAVREAYKGNDPSQGALYYFNPDIATSEWIKTRTIERMIGNHAFAN